MPNTGKPSPACHLCRKRRVKCDLGRPSCQRCIKYGVECEGYRDQQDLIFKASSPSTLPLRRRKKASPGKSEIPSTTSTPPPTPESSEPNDRLAPSKKIIALPSPRSLTERWTSHSVPMVLHVYSNLAFLREVYNVTDSDGPLTWAAHLFAHTYVTNLRYPTAVSKASREENTREIGIYLGKTLSAVSKALETPGGADRDDVLATVWILTNYEVLIGNVHRHWGQLEPWNVHARGLYTVLKTRGNAQLYSFRGRQAFWPSFNIVQIQAVLISCPCPPETDEWLAIIRDTLYPDETLIYHVSLFLHRLTRIQSRIVTILRSDDHALAAGEYTSLVDQLLSAEHDVANSIAMDVPFLQPLDVYTHNVRHSTHLKVLHALFLLGNYLTHYAQNPSYPSIDQLRQHRGYCLRTIRAAAKAVLDSLPLAIGALSDRGQKSPKTLFDALKMTWPLAAVYLVPSTTPEQKLKARVALDFIGCEMGVKQALNRYPMAGSGLPAKARISLDAMQEQLDEKERSKAMVTEVVEVSTEENTDAKSSSHD